MPRLTVEQRTWICVEMSRVDSSREVVRRWAAFWPDIPPPTRRAVSKLYRKFLEYGTCHNRNKGNSGRSRTVRSEENVERVRQALIENGSRSSRRNGLHLSATSFRRIVRDLKFHPYVAVRRQRLLPRDSAQRMEFCQRLLNTVEQEPRFLDNLVVSDEAIFSLNSEVNSKNVVEYAESRQGHPPNHYIDCQQGPGQVMVWAGFTRNGNIFGYYFVNGRLDTREYLRIIRYNVIQREFREQNVDQGATWWQQDGAPAHISNASMRYLGGQFPGKVMSKRGDWPWPPRSPDLTVCDFFLWGYLKHQIWKENQPQNLGQLRLAITRELHAIPLQMIQNAFDAMIKRCRSCIDNGGNNIPNE